MQKWTPVGEAKQFILSRIAAISECETVPVRAALGRVWGRMQLRRLMFPAMIIRPWTALPAALPI